MPSIATPSRFQASPAPSELLDTRYKVETPEGIDLILRPASLLPRALAFAVDLAIRGLLLGLLFVAFALLGKLGKKLLGLRVVHDDGTPVGWAASLTRNLLRFVDFLPFAYGLGILSCLNHPAFKRLGDLAAGTLVVYQETPSPRPPLPPAEPLPEPFALSLDEQRAILAFAERQGSLSDERRQEVAALLAEPLQVAPEQAQAQLNGIARGMLGPT
ncbi:MAG: hypothetical protein CFE49_07360 [Pseudomonas sp. PGPPP3]|nr:MAG: hypothetical protein CFE49_07360 [Pseudomonas sp. PGPPP3]